MANILVVDDEMGIRELLSEILGDEGHAITLAENAQQARDARAAGAPDLVLLDIWMPDTDGVTLLKEWQRDGLLTMPVIMMSGHATIDTAVEATRIGALNFLEKPIALQKLLKAVQQGLSRAQEAVRAPVIAPRPQAVPQVEEAVMAAAAQPMYGVQSQQSALAPRMGGLPHGEGHGFSLSFDLPLREARDAFERTHLYRKLKQLGVEPGKLAKKGG